MKSLMMICSDRGFGRACHLRLRDGPHVRGLDANCGRAHESGLGVCDKNRFAAILARTSERPSPPRSRRLVRTRTRVAPPSRTRFSTSSGRRFSSRRSSLSSRVRTASPPRRSSITSIFARRATDSRARTQGASSRWRTRASLFYLSAIRFFVVPVA